MPRPELALPVDYDTAQAPLPIDHLAFIWEMQLEGGQYPRARALMEGFWPQLKTNHRQAIVAIRLNVPPQEYRQGRKGRLVDFATVQEESLAFSSLLAVAGVMQGTRVPIRQRVKPDLLVPFADDLKDRLSTHIAEAGSMAQDGIWDRGKISFYRELQGIINQGVQEGAYSAFCYCLSEYDQGFGIFKAFFPNFSKLLGAQTSIDGFRGETGEVLREEIPEFQEVLTHLYSMGSRRVNIEEIMLQVAKRIQDKRRVTLPEIIKNVIMLAEAIGQRELFRKTDLALELAILTNQDLDSISILGDLVNDGEEELEASLDFHQQKHLLRQVVSERLRIGDPVPFSEYPDPRDYGLKVSRRETHMLRRDFGLKDALVVPVTEISKNPRAYWEYQKAVVLKIAQELGIESSAPVPLPEMPDVLDTDLQKRSEQVFREHEKLLRRISDWLWLLLYPQVQERFFRLLPYSSVPPYVMLGDQAVPAWDKGHQTRIVNVVKEHPNAVVNQTPFLNYTDYIKSRDGKRLLKITQRLTVPAVYVEVVNNAGGFCYIDHGMARLFYRGKAEKLEAGDYAVFKREETWQYPRVDVDMLVYGTKESPGLLANRAIEAHRRNLHGGMMTGMSMRGHRGVDYGYIGKSEKTKKSIRQNPWRAAHHKSCIMQAIGGWQGRETAVKTDLLIETLIGLSRARTVGLIPEIIEHDGYNAVLVKAVDLFGGLLDYSGVGGGVEVKGVKRNVIRLISSTDALPQGQAMAVWHILRIVADVCLSTDGGVFLPALENVPGDYSRIDSRAVVKRGAAQFRMHILSIAGQLTQILAGLDSYPREDAVLEGRKSAFESLNTDPYAFLILCSGKDVESPQRGLIGVELSKLYPHIHAIRGETKLWQAILQRVAREEREEGEPGVALVARIILETEGARKVIADAIRVEFAEDPTKVAVRMFSDRGNWQVLDPNGLGPWASIPKVWRNLLIGIERGKYQITDWSDVQRIASTQPRIYGAGTRQSIAIKRQRWEQRINEDDREFKKRQIEALVDWLVEPGF